jgi:hypothetical protein
MKKTIKNEINEALKMLEANGLYLEDCSSFVQTLSDKEVYEISKAVEKQCNVPCRPEQEGLDLRVQLKCALFNGAIPVL